MIDTQTTDRDLLARLSRGDRTALGELARRHEQPMLGLARGLLGGTTREELARDAVQDVWVRVIKYGSTYRGTSEVKTWLYRLLINRCRDVRHGESRRNGTIGEHLDPAWGGPTTAKTQSNSGEINTRLHAEMRRLPAPTRLLLLLCYHQGLTHEQAAAVLDIPVGTLKSRLHAALTTLRGRLASEVGP